jgi:hypothetical protein
MNTNGQAAQTEETVILQAVRVANGSIQIGVREGVNVTSGLLRRIAKQIEDLADNQLILMPSAQQPSQPEKAEEVINE